VTVGVIGLWTAVLLFVPRAAWDWSAVPYFAFSGVVGTAGGRLFRTVAIDKVGAPVAAAIFNLTPLIATGLAIALLHERITGPILAGTVVIVAGTVLLSLSGKYVRVPDAAPHLPRARRHVLRHRADRAKDGAQPGGAPLRRRGQHHGGHDRGLDLRDRHPTMARAPHRPREPPLPDRRRPCRKHRVTLLIVALGYGEVSVVTPLIGTAPSSSSCWPSSSRAAGGRWAGGW
jgi:uncharacterized membrane protein